MKIEGFVDNFSNSPTTHSCLQQAKNTKGKEEKGHGREGFAKDISNMSVAIS